MVNKNRCSNFNKVILISVVMILLYAVTATATVYRGNVTLRDLDSNSTTFNFSNQSYSYTGNAGGYIRVNNNISSSTYLQVINGAQLFFLGFYDEDEQGTVFRSDLVQVPNGSYQEPVFNNCYGCTDYQFVWPGGLIALYLPDLTYAALFIKNVTEDGNVTFEYVYNDNDTNRTFAEPLSGCQKNQNFTSCFRDSANENVSNECFWSVGICIKDSHEFDDHDFAECGSLPRVACDAVNETVCVWDWDAGSQGACTRGANFSALFGFNCTAIHNQTVCNNQDFTEGTGLCTWNATNDGACDINLTKSFADLPERTVWSCDAPGYSKNLANCSNLTNSYYMPCGWNNVTTRCENLFFDFDRFADFDDISSNSTCNTFGGTWVTEVTFDPVTKKLSEESWCELGVAVKTFNSIGGGGQSFAGDSRYIPDCGRDCFGCEFQANGSRWADSATASLQCATSSAGCRFIDDSNAFNGFGYCSPSEGAGGFNCDSFCGDCQLDTFPEGACRNSTAGCRWDNQTNFCIDSGAKGCGQDCLQCEIQSACLSSQASGGCIWETDTNICIPKGGSYEICFDGIDNDNNGKTDCADFKCSSDPFCGGGSFDTNNCFKYDSFTYNSNTNTSLAQLNCSAASGCTWLTDDFNFSFCGPTSELCWMNESFFTDSAGCAAAGDGDTCVFVTSGACHENATLFATCAPLNSANCATTIGCKYNVAHNFCDIAPIVTCEENDTLQGNQTSCIAAGCVWQGPLATGGFASGSQFDGFEGGFFDNCVSPCIASNISTQAECENADNGTAFFNHTCQWFTGHCEPKNFVGGCWTDDGDITGCQANPGCKYIQDNYGGLIEHPNSSNNYGELFAQDVWMGIGMQRPTGGNNESIYSLNHTNGQWLRLLMTGNGTGATGLGGNISRIYCNETVLMEYNWTNNTCMTGNCTRYDTGTCAGQTVHFIHNISVRGMEAIWEVPLRSLAMDSVEDGNFTVTSTTNATTIVLDGNMSEMMVENSSANDSRTNVSRIRTAPGFCNDLQHQNFFGGLDNEAPLEIAADPAADNSITDYTFIDFSGIGVKKTPEAYMYGMPTAGMSGSVICNGVPVSSGAIGGNSNTSKYYLYLDTDGTATGGCAALDNASTVGFEYLFKYIAQEDSTNGKLKETKLSLHCSSGNWVASNVPFKSDKNKACTFVDGPIIGVDRDALSSKSDVNTSKGWRAYAASAAQGGNATNVSDRVGPGSADFKGIDVGLFDCSSTADKDNTQCSSFKQFGFFPGEFGPACADNIDNDGDGLTDCSDFDCVYDPFFCSGSFGAVSGDETSPTIVWNKVNNRIPTALSFIFDTNEPANGTLKYYYNDSSCATLNSSSNDKAYDNTDTHDDYRPHHVVDLAGLAANTTYFYKLKVCDPSDNCAVSSCTNVTTATKHINVTFKLELPTGWTVDIPSINLTNYSASYALKASTAQLQNMNITLNDTTTANRTITLVGVSLFEKQTLNISRFLNGADYSGFDANQYANFKQKTGLDKAIVKIPTSATHDVMSHCDDNGENCQDVSNKVDCTYGGTSTICTIIDSVGLGFSTYKSSSSTASSSSSSSTSSSSSSGGGGGSVSTTTPTEEAATEGGAASGGEAEDTGDAESPGQAAAAPAPAQEEVVAEEEEAEKGAFFDNLGSVFVDLSSLWVVLIVVIAAGALGGYVYLKKK